MWGLMADEAQVDLAISEKISRSAVSQQIRTDGLGIVLTASGWLSDLP